MNISTMTLLIAATVATSSTWPVLAHADDDLPACQSGQVVISASPVPPAVTHRAVLLNFALAADAPSCSLTGYPGVDTYVGGPPLHAERTPRGYLGGLPADLSLPPTIALTKGEPAHAVVEGDAVDSAGNACPTYTSLRVTPPDNTDTQNVAVAIDTCALQVHPVGSTS